jgi:hypothetical protein
MSDFLYSSAEQCPDVRKHAKEPLGYLQRHDWMEKRTKTHVQSRCPTCGYWVIWTPKPFKRYRKDGWPICPSCDEDELWSRLSWGGISVPPLADFIAAGLSCYRCNWHLPPSAAPSNSDSGTDNPAATGNSTEPKGA